MSKIYGVSKTCDICGKQIFVSANEIDGTKNPSTGWRILKMITDDNSCFDDLPNMCDVYIHTCDICSNKIKDLIGEMAKENYNNHFEIGNLHDSGEMDHNK